VPISPNTTPMLPSVRAQKPEVTAPFMGFGGCDADSHDKENTLTVDLIPAAIDAFRVACQSSNHSTGAGRDLAESKSFATMVWRYYSRLVRLGFRPGGSGGSSRINVIVTRRFAGNVGSSGNSGWLSPCRKRQRRGTAAALRARESGVPRWHGPPKGRTHRNRCAPAGIRLRCGR